MLGYPVTDRVKVRACAAAGVVLPHGGTASSVSAPSTVAFSVLHTRHENRRGASHTVAPKKKEE